MNPSIDLFTLGRVRQIAHELRQRDLAAWREAEKLAQAAHEWEMDRENREAAELATICAELNEPPQ